MDFHLVWGLFQQQLSYVRLLKRVSFLKKKNIFSLWAAPGLSCGTWGLRCRVQDLLVAARRDLVSWPGFEPGPPALGTRSLNHWTTREVPTLTNYVPHSAESLLNSHHTRHYSVSQLTSSEVFLLSAPNSKLVWYNNLNPATLLPAPQEENNRDCTLLTDYLLAPRNDFQEAPMDNVDLI